MPENEIPPAMRVDYYCALVASTKASPTARADYSNPLVKHKKKDDQSRPFLVLVIGLEPIRLLHRGILSPLRLPIPPHKREKVFSL